jgi:hypothetical protein
LGDSPAISAWTKQVFAGLEQSAEDALRSLTPTGIYTGRGDSTGLNFVRRYVMKDGTYKGIHSGNPSEDYLDHETVADPELRTIRFDCGDKKDIVMVNWQCHAASDGSLIINGKHVVSADFIDKLRSGVEKELDVNFAYYNGASANLAMTSKIPGKQIAKSTDELATALVDVVKVAVQSEKQVNSGKIYASAGKVTGEIFQDSAEKRAAAKGAKGVSKSISTVELYRQYGIHSYYEAIHIGERAGLGKTQDIPLYAISFGDIAFAGAPFEMSDKTGVQIRQGAECVDSTFICAYTGGSACYLFYCDRKYDVITDDCWFSPEDFKSSHPRAVWQEKNPPYLYNAAQRKTLGGTCYFEFQRGRFRGKHWLERSVFLHMDRFEHLKLYELFTEALSHFDYFSFTEVTPAQYETLKSLAMNRGCETAELFRELDHWVQDCFFTENVFTICGI